jgi:putative FmdB family regulatory protein
MPLYEYECKQCGHRFERIQSFSAPDEKECPVCHGEVERLISTPARPHFKGSGFYSTDYAAKPAGSAKSGDGSSSGSDGASTASDKSGSDKASTNKPAAKTESAPATAPSTSTSKSD